MPRTKGAKNKSPDVMLKEGQILLQLAKLKRKMEALRNSKEAFVDETYPRKMPLEKMIDIPKVKNCTSIKGL